MTRALALAAALLACSRGEPADQPARDAARAKAAAAPPEVVRHGRAAASCPPLPDPVATRQAPAARRWPLRIAARARGENRTRAYRIARTSAAASGARWAGTAHDGAVLWEGTRRVRELPCGELGCTPHDAQLAADGKTLLVGLNRIDLASGSATSLPEARRAIEGAGMNEVTAVAWAPDGALVLAATHHRPRACCRDGSHARDRPPPPDRVLALDGQSGALVRDLGEVPGFSHSLAASSAQLVAATAGGITAWDRATFAATRRDAPRSAGRMAFDRSGRWLATTERGEITLWRMPDFCPVARLGDEHVFVHAFAFHPTAPVLFAATEHTVHAYALDAPGEELGAAEVTGGSGAVAQTIDSLAVTADGKLLVVPVYLADDVLFFDVTPP
ncbi:MAG TPA: hypothetical protein VFU21_28290 [Kofleriaceae bacterium]|nr:hypothetical protein [Kofleriaceae bacterium]